MFGNLIDSVVDTVSNVTEDLCDIVTLNASQDTVRSLVASGFTIYEIADMTGLGYEVVSEVIDNA